MWVLYRRTGEKVVGAAVSDTKPAYIIKSKGEFEALRFGDEYTREVLAEDKDFNVLKMMRDLAGEE